MFPCGSELLSQIDEFASVCVWARPRGFARWSLLDQNEEIRPLGLTAFDWDDLQIDCLRPTVLRKAYTFPANRSFLLLRPVQRRAEIERQFFPHQFQHVEGCGPPRRRQVRAGVPIK